MSRPDARLPEGVLAVWKPAGWTSHDVVAKARRLTGQRRIGHTGTLDPAVTGVLPICLGRATRMAEYLQEMPKAYEATLQFGVATDTEDLTGRVLEERDASSLTEAKMTEAVLAFQGEIWQVPPMVSAVKVDGKRLYEWARQGVTVDRKPRRATIHRIEVLDVKAGVPRPEIRFSVRCSKGTYIRTLCADIGRSLGFPAAMAELVRTESAGLKQADCLTLDELAAAIEEGRLQERLLPADRLLAHIPSAAAGQPEAVHALQGKALAARRLAPAASAPGLWRLYREDGAFLGLFRSDGERLKPVKVFHPNEETDRE